MSCNGADAGQKTHTCMCVCAFTAAKQRRGGDVTCREQRGLRIELQRLPAYILQGGTNLSPQGSLDWPGSESSTVQSRENGEGGGDGEQGGGKALH